MDIVANSLSRELVGPKTRCSIRNVAADADPKPPRISLSTFERILATHPPVLESLLLQLPTLSILHLYHTSRFLRCFLQTYPLAWNHLSFRLATSGRSESRQPSPASDASGETLFRSSKQHALDQLLLTVVIPFGSRLRSLDLDHTSVTGVALTGTVLPARRETLQHLSVRGCKHVSLKYHIVPYLTIFSLQKSVGERNSPFRVDHLALKSLYTFRCRHHRRRPYLPASLLRRDSDADPTHELIKICYHLGIWTDTAWCPTPGGRCLRRKDYYTGRGNLDGRGEVWVVFDRLWRSGNRLGQSNGNQISSTYSKAQLWETAELGHDGEPLGCSELPGQGEGKMIPTHLRKSHKVFVENYNCHDCGDRIPERCEQCSVRMHCMGCRKTLCASCAFSRPLPRSKGKGGARSSMDTADEGEQQELFWWAPGETRSPNLMMQESSNDDGLTENQANSSIIPAMKMHWCCLKPVFSGGTGITFGGPGLTGAAAGQIRTAPLPRGQGWEDSEFARIRKDEDLPKTAYGTVDAPDYTLGEGHDQMLHWFLHGPGSQDNSMCPRSLCQECWQTPRWRAACQACHVPVCFAHDLRGLKMRICGYRDLTVEKRLMKERSDLLAQATQRSNTEKEEDLLECIKGLLALTETLSHTPETILDLAVLTSLPDTNDDELADEPDSLAAAGKPSVGPSSPPIPTTSSEELQLLPRIVPTSSTRDTTVFDFPFLGTKPPPPWHGCASFLCPEFRSMGDHRPKCSAAAKECTACGVHVCPDCLVANPACDCSLCKERYRCPNCFRAKPAGSCKKEEEDEKKRMENAKALKRRIEALRLERESDEMLEGAGEFLRLVQGDLGGE